MEDRSKTVAPDAEDELPPPVPLPTWVPVLIGLILVAMGGAALYTGLKFRDQPFRKPVARLPLPSRPPRSGPAAVPGEPQPGSSRMSEAVPSPEPIDTAATSRYTITGSAHDLAAQTRLAASRGMILNVEPPDALVYVNNDALGEARQFDSADSLYEFPDEGTYNVKISAAGYLDSTFVVVADPNAKDEIAAITVKLVKNAKR